MPLQGFTHGIMIVGEYSGKKVSDVKPTIKVELVEAGEAIVYSEPESTVVSRSGGNWHQSIAPTISFVSFDNENVSRCVPVKLS